MSTQKFIIEVEITDGIAKVKVTDLTVGMKPVLRETFDHSDPVQGRTQALEAGLAALVKVSDERLAPPPAPTPVETPAAEEPA